MIEAVHSAARKKEQQCVNNFIEYVKNHPHINENISSCRENCSATVHTFNDTEEDKFFCMFGQNNDNRKAAVKNLQSYYKEKHDISNVTITPSTDDHYRANIKFDW